MFYFLIVRGYIGFNDRVTEDKFFGEDSTGPMTYRNFGPLEPNNANNEDCVETNFAYTGSWNDVHCNTPLNAFCQKDLQEIEGNNQLQLLNMKFMKLIRIIMLQIYSCLLFYTNNHWLNYQTQIR